MQPMQPNSNIWGIAQFSHCVWPIQISLYSFPLELPVDWTRNMARRGTPSIPEAFLNFGDTPQMCSPISRLKGKSRGLIQDP